MPPEIFPVNPCHLLVMRCELTSSEVTLPPSASCVVPPTVSDARWLSPLWMLSGPSGTASTIMPNENIISSINAANAFVFICLHLRCLLDLAGQFFIGYSYCNSFCEFACYPLLYT